jgi:threonyl-tRNA synthetase
MADIKAKRHSLAHILAMAVLELRPDTKLGIGPVIENGFYYDFDFSLKEVELPSRSSTSFNGAEDLPKIEDKMRELIKQDLKFIKREVSVKEAKELFSNQPYKLELITELAAEKKPITMYYTSPSEIKNLKLKIKNCFADLCAGPHVDSTKDLINVAFKLTKIAGAYWKGSEKNPMLTRIYGAAFETEKEINDYLKIKEEAEKRDHRKLGKDLGLFVFSDLVGKGLPLFTSKGATIRRELERFIINEEIKRGYEHVVTPHLAKVNLYRTSGHYPYYKKTMYPPMKIDEEELILRPMTCPHHFMLYKARLRSYKELPIKYAELASQFRYEKSGELSGLSRVRTFCLADAHIFAKNDQVKDVISDVLDLIEYANNIFGLEKGKDYRYRLSLGDRCDDKKYYKDDAAWDRAEEILRDLLKRKKEPFFESPNEAAFYGPKIDIQMKDVFGNEETAFTLQYDFVMPKRFELKYIDADGKEKQPIVIHRSSIGTIERTMAFLIEHCGGAFPVWLSPVQIEIMAVSEKFDDYANEIMEIFKKENIRAEFDNSNETISKKIRQAELQKIPYILVVGEKEKKSKTIAVRQRGEKNVKEIKVDEFVEKIKMKIETRS